MSRWCRTRSRLASLALLLPLAFAAAAQAEQPTKPAPAPTDAELAAQVTRGLTGTIMRITSEQIFVRNLGEGSGGTGIVALTGGDDVQVAGLRTSWETLAEGDLVAIAYHGEPPRAVGIQVLPPGLNAQLQAASGQDPFLHKGGREFMGWIKLVDANTLIVRTPDGPPGSNRKGDVKTFVRTPDTKVGLLRKAWGELEKGDRISVAFSKGEPRPANKVTVVLRAGEKPLPRGLATRLYDARWDVTVKDVDGIGEWPVGEPWPPQAKSKAADPKPDAQPAPAPAPAN